MPKTGLTDSERRQRAKIATNVGWAHCPDRTAGNEPVAPVVAKQIRSYTNPEMLKAYIELLTAVLLLIFALWNVLGSPPSVTQITYIFQTETNVTTTHVTNFPPVVPAVSPSRT